MLFTYKCLFLLLFLRRLKLVLTIWASLDNLVLLFYQFILKNSSGAIRTNIFIFYFDFWLFRHAIGSPCP